MEKTKNFFKRFWAAIIFIPATIIGLIIVFWKHGGEIYKLLSNIRKIQDDTDRHVDKIREDESIQQEKNEDRHNQIMKKIEQDYVDQKKDFNEKKKQEVNNLIQKSKNDPKILADELSKITGFKVILPED